ncbi:Protein GLB-5 a [Aphelenchoides avenae]|nr:Protein GLB-5 a [Aphelenchus avenae]
MYHDYQRGILRDFSIDVHELNAMTDDSTYDSSSDSEGARARRQSLESASEREQRRIIDSDDDYSEETHLARAHWIQLYKTNMQMAVIQRMFIHVLTDEQHMRPIWQFTRDFAVGQEDLVSALTRNVQFKTHCASVQAALTMVMDNLDDPNGMAKLLQAIGAHHFFYDAYEPHLELIHDGFMKALKELLADTTESLDERLENAWNQLWNTMKSNIGYGIALQRHAYLAQCLTPSEMHGVQKMWKRVKDFGLEECGKLVTGIALKTYKELLDKYKTSLPVPLEDDGEVFTKFSNEVIQIIESTIEFYSPESGFTGLAGMLKGFVHHCIMIDVCPTLVRKAFVEGLISMLKVVLGDQAMTENVVHTWNKIYRVLEQAILTNIVDY